MIPGQQADATRAAAEALRRALVAFQRGGLQDAERICRALLGTDPIYAPALHLLGIIAGQTQRTQEAVELLSRAVAVDPGNAEAHHHLGVAWAAQRRHTEALASYERALALQPGYADAVFNSAVALLALGRDADALESFDHCLATAPGFAPAHNGRAIALSRMGRHEDALASSERAIALRRDYAEAQVTRGNALRALRRPAEALEWQQRAVGLRPDLAEAWSNRGNALADLARYAEAIRSYERALTLRPDHADAHFNLSLCALLQGDFARGWDGYEWRQQPERRPGDAHDGIAVWRGEAGIAGKTILLHAEQGLGDTLQFCRYAPLVAAMDASVVLEVQTPLVALLQRLEGVSHVIAQGAPLPPVDLRCPLPSLPRAFRTDGATIPADVPYVRSYPELLAKWSARLGRATRPRVGLVWSGNPVQARDYSRSMRLAEMLPLLHPGIEWIGLQRDVRAVDSPVLASCAQLRHFGDALADFADTAALADMMDVVVTVDTGVAHLAGAMGKDVWILLAFNPDWRWLLERDDSPWYPTARLFRQPAPGDWASVIDRVREALQTRFA